MLFRPPGGRPRSNLRSWIRIRFESEILDLNPIRPIARKARTSNDFVCLAARPAGAAERGYNGVLEVKVLCALEELVIFRVGARETAFDEVHAKRVQAFSDRKLVVDRERDAFLLRPVPKSGVVYLYLFGHLIVCFRHAGLPAGRSKN